MGVSSLGQKEVALVRLMLCFLWYFLSIYGPRIDYDILNYVYSQGKYVHRNSKKSYMSVHNAAELACQFYMLKQLLILVQELQ